MTEAADRDADGRAADDAGDDATQTLGDISHTNPYTNETFGGIYRRGPAVADGGAAPTPVTGEGADPTPVTGEGADPTSVDSDDSSADADSADRTQTMGDIDHTPRDLNVNNVWDRGDSNFVPGDD